MSSSLIVFVLVLVAGWLAAGDRRPPVAHQRAMSHTTNGRVGHSPGKVGVASPLLAAIGINQNDDDNIVVDTLRVLGLLRKRVDNPVVGRKAYVRWWERLRAAIVLSAIIVLLGITLAAVIGMTVLSLGFLLEHAIS